MSASTIESVARLIGDRWSMLVIRDVFRGVRRFDELRDDLGVSRAVLSDRLKRLVAAGVLERSPYQDHPPRFEYTLSPMGLELSPMLVALLRWGDRWLGHGDPTAVLVHAPCGTELEQAFWCRRCRTTFGPTAIRAADTADTADGPDNPHDTPTGDDTATAAGAAPRAEAPQPARRRASSSK